MARQHQGLIDSRADFGIKTADTDAWHNGMRSDPVSPRSQQNWLSQDSRRIRRPPVEEEHARVENEIRQAQYILQIGNEVEDSDFVPYRSETLTRATAFLRRLAIHAHSCGFTGFGVPEIVPADKGSVDLLWRSANRQLLMNFPDAANSLVSFYGKKGKSEISGRFEAGTFRPELVYWLVE